jgi:hypothetical protein
MRRSHSSPTTVSPSDLQSFRLPGILPEHTILYLDQESRTLLLLQHDEPSSCCLLHIHQFSPTVLKALTLLLRTYPSACTYETLIHTCFPTLPHSDPSSLQLEARPLRHIIHTLQLTLPSFGILILGLRTYGYVLASPPKSASSGEITPSTPALYS